MKPHRLSLIAGLLGLLTAALPGGSALAQYKIVGPDGRVTYTDRLSPENAASAQPMRTHSGGNQILDQSGAWPQELRDAARRYPVTLYTQRNCTPCDSARTLLAARGVPFAEKSVNTPADTSAFTALTGGDRLLPLLTIGQQMLKGLNAGDWNSYLDAAGYPKTSRLPNTYRQPPATPLTTPPAAASDTGQDSPAAARIIRRPAPADTPQNPPAGGAPAIRF